METSLYPLHVKRGTVTARMITVITAIMTVF